MSRDDEFKEISFEEFEQYRVLTKETDFLVVDVRQEDEYAAGHVPGAKLIPLNTLGNHLFELALDKDLFFYCRSGARSAVAGMMAAESGRDPQKTYNIPGGFLVYQGHSLEGFPWLQVFDDQESDDRLLYKAMELEKGAELFYETILCFAPEEKTFKAPIEQLAKAEIAHARTIYSYWKQTVDNPTPFEDLYGSLKGEILENGQPLSKVTADLHANKKIGWIDVIEMALNIEIQAYDLYRTMAERLGQGEAQEALLSIAQMEKAHMKVVAKMLGGDFN